MSADGPRSTEAPPSKATLHCPTCGHQSRYDGDWRLLETVSHTQYRCPECHTAVVSRPATGQQRPTPPLDLWRAWYDRVRAWQERWWQARSAK